MNKLSFLSVILIALQAAVVQAQPVIDKLYDFQPGFTYDYFTLPSGSVIDTNLIPTIGANITWDLDALPWENQLNTDSISSYDPTIHSTLFPNCSFVYTEFSGLNQFYRKSNDTLFYMGNSTSNGQFNPNAINVIYPTEYQSSGYKFTNYNLSLPWGGTWSYSGRYNAYGTLKLNGLTYSNVGLYVVKGGTPGQYYIDYMWVRQGEILPLVRIQFLQTSASMNVQFGYGLASAVLNVENITQEHSIVLYPNPTTDVLNLSINSEWSLYNMNGQCIATGSGTKIHLLDYEKGVYWVSIGEKKYKIIKR